MPHHHHNPLDLRDPLAPAFYLSFIADDNGRPSRRSRGGDMPGCLALLLLAVLVLIIVGLTK